MTPSAQTLFDEGRLADAIQAQTDEVRSQPTDPERRHLLFALLCFAGELDRAARQLEALGVGTGPMIEMRMQLYRSLLVSEQERREVWAGKAHPLLAPDAPAALVKRVEGLHRLSGGDAVRAGCIFDEASHGALAVRGTLNGRPFEQIRDTDDLGASVVEVFAQGRCLWLAFEQIQSLELAPPKGLLDLVWAPARLRDARGHEAGVHLPTLYCGSHQERDDRLRLGRTTEWVEVAGVGARGVGQKVWLVMRGDEEDEIGLLEVRSLAVGGT